jgi:hypothetical protein
MVIVPAYCTRGTVIQIIKQRSGPDSCLSPIGRDWLSRSQDRPKVRAASVNVSTSTGWTIQRVTPKAVRKGPTESYGLRSWG